MSGPQANPTEDDRPGWYRWIVNVLAAVLLFFLWRLAAWACSKWISPTQSEDHWFLSIVAMTLALGLPSRRKSRG